MNEGQTGRKCEEKITFRPAAKGQYSDFFLMLLEEAGDYLQKSIKVIGLDLSQFRHKFETVGQMYGIYVAGKSAGFYWIEKRKSILHIHGLVLEADFQGHGIGSFVLDAIEERHGRGIDLIELGVHKQNLAAVHLYKKKGYHEIKSLDEIGFLIMHKNLRE